MSSFGSGYTRRLVPIWRTSNKISGAAEFCSHQAKIQIQPNLSLSRQKYKAWKRKKSVGGATDAFATAVATGDLESVRGVTEYLIAQGDKVPPLTRNVIQRLTRNSKLEPQFPLSTSELVENVQTNAKQQVSQLRKKLIANPKNPLAQLDLSRAYSVLGQTEKSTKAAVVANHLMPNSRYVLRNVARQYLQHEEDNTIAYRVLLNNPATKHDPWLVAAEISFSIVAGKSPKYSRQAIEMLRSGKYSDAHLAELRSAMGTLYYFEGVERKSRASIRASLVGLNDNTLAQASWINSKLGGIELPEQSILLPTSYEAIYSQHRQQGEWEHALSACLSWMAEEPYSPRAARMASSLCISVIENSELAVQVANVGLRSSPSNNDLLNTKAIAQAYSGDVISATKTFNKIKLDESDNFPHYVYFATAGLLYFRSGFPERGRELYIAAEAKAPNDAKALVRLYRAREELEHSNGSPNQFVEKVIAEKLQQNDLWSIQIQRLLNTSLIERTSEQPWMVPSESPLSSRPFILPSLKRIE